MKAIHAKMAEFVISLQLVWYNPRFPSRKQFKVFKNLAIDPLKYACECTANYEGDNCELDKEIHIPDPPTTCSTKPELSTTQKDITSSYINEISNALGNDFLENGPCFQMFQHRIYGSLQYSDALIDDGKTYQDFYMLIESDTTERRQYSQYVKFAFKEAFEDCQSSACVVEKFCAEYATFHNTATSLKQQINDQCVKEGWRFQRIILNGGSNATLEDACHFDIGQFTFY